MFGCKFGDTLDTRLKALKARYNDICLVMLIIQHDPIAYVQEIYCTFLNTGGIMLHLNARQILLSISGLKFSITTNNLKMLVLKKVAMLSRQAIFYVKKMKQFMLKLKQFYVKISSGDKQNLNCHLSGGQTASSNIILYNYIFFNEEVPNQLDLSFFSHRPPTPQLCCIQRQLFRSLSETMSSLGCAHFDTLLYTEILCQY